MTSRAAAKQNGGRVRRVAPAAQGLYDPQFEHEACGVGFVVNLKGKKSRAIIQQAIQILVNLDDRGACGCEANTGAGAGLLIQTPHEFLKLVSKEAKVIHFLHQRFPFRAVRSNGRCRCTAWGRSTHTRWGKTACCPRPHTPGRARGTARPTPDRGRSP